MENHGREVHEVKGHSDSTGSGMPVGDPLRIRLMKLFWMLGPAYVRWAESQMEHDGISPQRMYLLGTLYEYGPMMMCDLKGRLGVTATNITAHVDALEREGLVTRSPHPADRRATLVVLTRKAEESLEMKCRPFMDRISEIFEGFTPKEQSTFLDYLLRMRTVLVEKKILEEKCRSFGDPGENNLPDPLRPEKGEQAPS
jgi:DNA-binding MarR family transcriptional regulator